MKAKACVEQRNGHFYGVRIMCLGCAMGNDEHATAHVLPVRGWCPPGLVAVDHTGQRDSWTFNGDFDNPTFEPSLLIRYEYGNGKHYCCHSFIRNGTIEYLGDCTHKYAGQTVELPELTGIDNDD